MEFMANANGKNTQQDPSSRDGSSSNDASSEAQWISLMDYATEYGVSLSTLRRHIKAGKIQHKVENGRYLLRSPFAKGVVAPARAVSMPAPAPAAAQPAATAPAPAVSTASAAATAEIRDLKARLQRAQEEIAELKMLVAIYEEQLAPNPKKPGHPQRVNGF
jgi:hypothetical protein